MSKQPVKPLFDEKLKRIVEAAEQEMNALRGRDSATTEKEELGIENIKLFLAWAAELIAEVILSIREGDIKGSFSGFLKGTTRFGNNVFEFFSILGKMKFILQELQDLDTQEGQELNSFLQGAIEEEFKKLELEVEEDDKDLVFDALSLLTRLAIKAKKNQK